MPGMAFARDGSGGEYQLSEDGSIGYYSSDGEAGRLAESMDDLFSLLVSCICSVSYTHLVFMKAIITQPKEQVYETYSLLLGTPKEIYLFNALGMLDDRCYPEAVSYTHLDVYKRQTADIGASTWKIASMNSW